MMSFSIKRLGVGTLLGAWAGYWVALGAVTLAPFLKWVWDVNRIPGQHGSASLSVGDAGATLTALTDGVTVYTGVAPLPDVALWIAGPPLVLWLLWLVLRPSRDEAAALHARSPFGALPDAARGGWAQPITPTSTPSPVERRDRRGS
jgi:hypothetical protein